MIEYKHASWQALGGFTRGDLRETAQRLPWRVLDLFVT